MKYFSEIIITPKELSECKIVEKSITLQRQEDVLITGTVLNRECEPIQKAVIVVTQIRYQDHILKKKLGYVITNQKGKFAIVLEKNNAIDYRLDIYEPMMI